jgi:hypothetical protein
MSGLNQDTKNAEELATKDSWKSIIIVWGILQTTDRLSDS